MQRLTEACERIAGTTKKLEKVAIVADYLKSRVRGEAAVSAVFLSGKPFPAWEETTLQVGGSLLWRTVGELSGKGEEELRAAYRQHGDLGAVAGAVLADLHRGPALSVLDVEQSFREIAAARGPVAKQVLVRDLLARATPLEAKYIVKVMTGDWQGVWRNSARGPAGQHAAGRHWRNAPTGGRWQAGGSENENVSSAGFHAGQPG